MASNVFWRVNGDKETNAIAHRRHVFALGVIRLNVIPKFLGLPALLVIQLALLGSEWSSRQSDKEYCGNAKQPAHSHHLHVIKGF